MKSVIVSTLCLIFCVTSCDLSSHPDLELEKKAIMEIHNTQKQAHIEKNVSLLLRDSSLDFMEVNRGIIKKPKYSESFDRLTAYFNSVEFIKWDDVAEPIFSFSDDATMATTIVDKLVITKNKSDNSIDTTHFAWLAVYKKEAGKWKLHRIGSTNR
jgi:hypothetical protein